MVQRSPSAGTSDVRLAHAPERGRYELHIDGALRGVADYQVRDGRVVFTHTVIDERSRGRGHGEQLVGFALDDVRAARKQAGATCWFVRDFATAHPEYRDLFE